MELFSFFKKAVSEDFRTIELKHFENSQLVLIVVDSDNKTWWKITIYGDEFEYNFFVKFCDSKEECDLEIKRLIELPYLNISDLESADYML